MDMNQGFEITLQAHSMVQLAVPVVESTHVGYVRRVVVKLARDLGFSDTAAGKVAIVVNELAGNLVKHSTQGQVLVRSLQREETCGIEIMALDKGPGMVEITKCLQDGYSTTGSPGTGLGAVARLSALFDIYSTPGVGTAVLAQLWAMPWSGKDKRHHMEIGAVCLPHPQEEVCGDVWEYLECPGRSLIFLADGLGHGPAASDAAREARRTFRENPLLAPADIIVKAHSALHATRGAAVAIAVLEHADSVVHYCGVGNISAAILSQQSRRGMISHSGIVGHQVRKTQEFTYPFVKDALLVMHSDGLGSRWSLEPYPGIQSRHQGLIAGVLYRDYRRGGDDVTVLVAQPRNKY